MCGVCMVRDCNGSTTEDFTEFQNDPMNIANEYVHHDLIGLSCGGPFYGVIIVQINLFHITIRSKT